MTYCNSSGLLQNCPILQQQAGSRLLYSIVPISLILILTTTLTFVSKNRSCNVLILYATSHIHAPSAYHVNCSRCERAAARLKYINFPNILHWYSSPQTHYFAKCFAIMCSNIPFTWVNFYQLSCLIKYFNDIVLTLTNQFNCTNGESQWNFDKIWQNFDKTIKSTFCLYFFLIFFLTVRIMGLMLVLRVLACIVNWWQHGSFF